MKKIRYAIVLLPVWISAFKYNNKIYRFLVNGSTGEVVGDSPYSKVKLAIAWTLSTIAFLTITFLVFNENYSFLIIIILGIIFLFFHYKK